MNRQKMNRRILFVWMGRQEMNGKEGFLTYRLHGIRGNDCEESSPHGAERGVDWTARRISGVKLYFTPKLGGHVLTPFFDTCQGKRWSGQGVPDLEGAGVHDVEIDRFYCCPWAEKILRFGRYWRLWYGDRPIVPLPMDRGNISDSIRF